MAEAEGQSWDKCLWANLRTKGFQISGRFVEELEKHRTNSSDVKRKDYECRLETGPVTMTVTCPSRTCQGGEDTSLQTCNFANSEF